MSDIVDIADLDCIFLTYDEPNAEENWVRVRNMVPWARRVDGIKGSDAAHKAAAMASTTDRFVLVDGDNIPYAEFFNQQLVLDDTNRDCVFRWRARNNINGLIYGNGGISCWTREFVLNMKTHEASDGSPETAVEFCFHEKYWAMAAIFSTTYPNGSPFQAWRAGFREGVKMCLDRGAKPDVSDFIIRINDQNLDSLTIWHNVGRDVQFGDWAIAGSRMGTYMTMCTNWDFTNVQNFDELAELWKTVENDQADILSNRLSEALSQQLGLPMLNLSAEDSSFFKHHYKFNLDKKKIMERE